MLKFGIILIISHIVLNGSGAQVSVEKQYPSWLLQLGVRAVPQETLTKRQNFDDKQTKGCELATQNSVQDILDLEYTKNEIVKNSGLPLVELGNDYYYFGTYFKTNFFKAMQFCRDHGMDLLSIETSNENSRIINYISTTVSNVDHWWTSGSDLGEEGNFAWLSTGKPLNFTFWSPPQPDNAGNIENCLEIWKLGDKHYIWNDIPCTNTYNFICEVRKCSDFCIN